MMKSTVAPLIFAVAGSVASAQTITHQTANPNVVTRVATALNHISLIELPEPITRAAVGSDDIRIEWQGNTVALKPVKQGQSTNLFVWTEHTQTSYEILPPGEVTNAAFVIDQTNHVSQASTQAHAPAEERVSAASLQKAEDMLIANGMLEGMTVLSTGVKDSHDHVTVRINDTVRHKDSLYVRYTVLNLGTHAYRVSDPEVVIVNSANAMPAGVAPRGTQIPSKKLNEIAGATTTTINVRAAHVENKDVNPGEKVEGVLCIPASDATKSQLYHFIFAKDQSKIVDAAVVL